MYVQKERNYLQTVILNKWFLYTNMTLIPKEGSKYEKWQYKLPNNNSLFPYPLDSECK